MLLRLLHRPLQGVADQLGAALKPQLVFDMFTVRFDRLDAHAQALRDLGGADALSDEVEDFELAV